MTGCLASFGVLARPWGVVLVIAHLLVAVFALGAVSHHWWSLLRGRLPLAVRYARWMAIGYPLAWLFGVVIYPTYNVLVRKPPLGILENAFPWAVGLFEIKEHVGTIALVMLPWLLLSVRNYDRLSPGERTSYRAATWVFTLFVYYSYVAGAIVASVKGMY